MYGRGAYFAEAALYSHWWFARHKPEVDDEGTEEYTLILAQVFTGRSKYYGPSWAPNLFMEPSGYHSVSGTESDQKVLPVVRTSTLTCILFSSVAAVVPSLGPSIAQAPSHAVPLTRTLTSYADDTRSLLSSCSII